MTCIVTLYQPNPPANLTKKKVKEMLLSNPERVIIEDPSPITPGIWAATELPLNRMFFITNHPKRSWFAQVTRHRDGTFTVK